MRPPKRGEKGFTLIELLIVVAILGVLAAVIIPNVGRFFGKGEEEARRTEYHNVASAVIAMMVDNGISKIPVPITDPATNKMDAFPDSTSSNTVPSSDDPGKVKDPDGDNYVFAGDTGDKAGYLLYGHDINGGDGEVDLVNYVTMRETTYFYTCDADGTVHQYDVAGGTEYTY